MKKEYEVCYESDFSGLKGRVERVVFPTSAEEVANLIKSSQNIVPRGFGISLVGGCVPDNSVVLDMRKMNKVTKFDGKSGSVWAEAGVSIKELNEKLKAVGFEFPVFSPDKALRSVGGVIALDLIGDRYGSVRNWVEEIEAVNGRGEIFRVGRADLMDVCGLEGITGVIVRAKLKVIPLIKRSASVFQSDDLAEVLSVARRLKLDREVVMLKFYSLEVSKMLGFPEKYHLIIEFDSLRGKITGENYEKIMKKKDKIYFSLYSKGYYESLDVKLFFDKIEEFVKFLDENKIIYFGDLGLGIIHSFFKNKRRREDILNFLRNTKTKFIGGFGIKREDLIEQGERKIIQRVKKRYDPFGKLNTGKVVGVTEKEKKEDVKSPVREMENLIEEVKAKEEENKQINNFVDKIEKRMEDYNQTFNTELVEERRKKIEEFSHEIPRKIVKEEDKKVDEELKGALDKFGLGAGFEKKKDDEKSDGERRW